MKKYPLLISTIATILLASIPGAFISIRDMNFSYPAAAVMIHEVKDGGIEGVRALLTGEGSGKTLEDYLPDEVKTEASAKPEMKPESGNASSDEEASSPGTDGVIANEDGSVRSDKDVINEYPINKDEGQRDSEYGDDVERDEGQDADGDDEEDDDEVNDENDDEGDEVDDGTDEPDDGTGEFTTVDNDYFLDACLIGDSRVQGLGMYSDLPATNYGIVSMQLYKIFDRRVINTDMGKVTIPEMLAVEPKYGKIYLGFGLNEMGWGNDGMFAERYYLLIDYIKAVQPQAIIYIMGVIHVTEAEEQRSALYKNSAIDARNELLRQIAEDEHVYFLDLNEVFTDEYGRLATEDSFDGVHIKAGAAINKWADYLRTHAIVR